MSGQTTGVRRILNRDKVRVAQAGVMVGCASPTTNGQPQVTVLRNDSGRIDQIEVTCGCGEIVVIDCQYENTISN
jgi:hypothetical protein